MRTRLKVCGIASADEAMTAVRAGASAIGLVGVMPSGPAPIDDAPIAATAALVAAMETEDAIMLRCSMTASR